MAKEEKKVDPKIDDLVAQVAAQTVRADNAEEEVKLLKKKLSEVEGERDSVRSDYADAKKELEARADEPVEKYKSQVQALVQKVERLEKERNDAASPERLRALVKDRVSLEKAAEAVLGGDARFDEDTDRLLMERVIEKLQGVKIDSEKTVDYVRARFDAAIEGYRAGNAALERVRAHIEEVKSASGDTRSDSRTARQKFIDEQNEVGRRPLSAR